MVLTSCSAVVNTDESSKDKINITDGAPAIKHEDKSIQKKR